MELILFKGSKVPQGKCQYFFVDWFKFLLCNFLYTEDNILSGTIFIGDKLGISLEKNHRMGR